MSSNNMETRLRRLETAKHSGDFTVGQIIADPKEHAWAATDEGIDAEIERVQAARRAAGERPYDDMIVRLIVPGDECRPGSAVQRLETLPAYPPVSRLLPILRIRMGHGLRYRLSSIRLCVEGCRPSRHLPRKPPPRAINARAIRLRTPGDIGLTQQSFADAIGVPVKTLRNWEQQRRQPTGPARVLLSLIERDPWVVYDNRTGTGRQWRNYFKIGLRVTI